MDEKTAGLTDRGDPYAIELVGQTQNGSKAPDTLDSGGSLSFKTLL